MISFFVGMQHFLSGFRLIAKPGLRRFVVIPLLLNSLFFTGLFIVLWHYAEILNQSVTMHLPGWLQWLSIIFWLLFFISFFLILIYFFMIIANIISAPFNSLLAEKVELYLTGELLAERSLMENIKDIPRTIGRQIAILLYSLPRLLLLLILFFIPIVQMAAVVLWFLFSAWLMTMTYTDYPSDQHRVSFKQLRHWLQARRLLALGFGIGVLVASMIPLVNFLVIPAACAGATEMWLVQSKRRA